VAEARGATRDLASLRGAAMIFLRSLESATTGAAERRRVRELELSSETRLTSEASDSSEYRSEPAWQLTIMSDYH